MVKCSISEVTNSYFLFLFEPLTLLLLSDQLVVSLVRLNVFYFCCKIVEILSSQYGGLDGVNDLFYPKNGEIYPSYLNAPLTCRFPRIAVTCQTNTQNSFHVPTDTVRSYEKYESGIVGLKFSKATKEFVK